MKTLYNYIDAGIFNGISNKNLWERGKRKKKPYHHIRRVSRTNREGRSIKNVLNISTTAVSMGIGKETVLKVLKAKQRLF
jgi:hypothetical protein